MNRWTGPIISFALHPSDLVAVQANEMISSSHGSYYITITSDTTTDLYNNSIVPIIKGLPGPVSTIFISDLSKSALINATLDFKFGSIDTDAMSSSLQVT